MTYPFVLVSLLLLEVFEARVGGERGENPTSIPSRCEEILACSVVLASCW